MSAITGPFPHGHGESAANAHAGQHGEPDNYLTHGRGLMSWLFTLDHKRIGLLYMLGVLTMFFIGGFFAVALRTTLWSPNNQLKALADQSAAQVVADEADKALATVSAAFNAKTATAADVAAAKSTADKAHEEFAAAAAEVKKANESYNLYNHYFSLHGAVMVFLFIIPAVPAIMGNFVLPMMLGAKDVAFPRLNLMSLWIYWIGAVFFVYVLLSGVLHAAFGWQMPGGWGIDTGWTFYTPYSSRGAYSAIEGAGAQGSVTVAVLGAFMLGFSSILTGVNFIATMHTLRPKGMTWFRMPLFLWALYATSIMQILATPVLAITLLLLAAERLVGVGIFDPKLGGDPVLFQHFFWFYSHPAVYIMILPAMGVISEVMVTFSRKHIFGYNFIAMSSLAIALVSFLVWGHHMFVSGQSPLSASIFSLLTMAVAIPSAVKVFNWLGTMYKGDIRLDVPMLYAIGFIYLFTIGGLTGLFLASMSTDIHLTHTYFIVAHFHYVMMGSTLFAFLAGMYYWWPKMFGKMTNAKIGKIGFLFVFIGFNLTFFPQFVMGARGMPRRYASYPTHFQIFHRLSTAGAYTMATGLVIAGINLLGGMRNGRKAAENPWGGSTLEWFSASPPPHDNFNYIPVAGDPYDLHGLEYDEKIDGWVRNEAAAEKSRAEGQREAGHG